MKITKRLILPIIILAIVFSIFSFTYTVLGNRINGLFEVTGINVKSIQFDFWLNVWAGFFGGCLLTLLLFFINEKLIPDHELTGEWLLEQYSEAATEYVGYRVFYKVHLLQKGKEIVGYGERIYQITDLNDILEFTPTEARKEIATIEITGYYQKRYLTSSQVKFFKIENGTKRKSSSIYIFEFRGKNELVGRFANTAANSYGNSKLRRNSLFDEL